MMNGIDALLAVLIVGAVIHRRALVALIDEYMPDSERRRWR